MQTKTWSAVVAVVAMTLAGAVLANGELPSGQRQLGRTIVEPGYDDRTGTVIYLMTPEGAASPAHANASAVSPLYIVVYPNSAAAAVGTMNCAHEGGDNCPDHGPGIASLAQAAAQGVYSDGVWGHDHIMDGPGGGAFNVGRQVVVVLFTSAAAARTHITTAAALQAAISAGDAFTVATPILIHVNLVSGATYERAIPLPPAFE